MEIKEVLAKNLKHFREDRKLTQDALAAASGVAVNSIRQYENAKANATLQSIALLAEALQVSIGQLCGENCQKNSINIETYGDLFEVLEQIRNLWGLDCGEFMDGKPETPQLPFGSVELKCEEKRETILNPFSELNCERRVFLTQITIKDKTTFDFFNDLNSMDELIYKTEAESTRKTLNAMKKAWTTEQTSKLRDVNIKHRTLAEAQERPNNVNIDIEFLLLNDDDDVPF